MASASAPTRRRTALIAWGFLLPNLIGFLLFTAGPVLFSLVMAFTDWSLVRHNDLSDEPVRFVGLENFRRILIGDEAAFFWRSFGNTAYLMLGIPVAIAGSLGMALLLHDPPRPRRASTRASGIAAALLLGAVSAAAAWLAMHPGAAPAGADATAHLAWEVAARKANAAAALLGLLGVIVAAGLATGAVFFRTLFYLPSLLAGIALYLLWKSLYKPSGGAINTALEPALNALQAAVEATPAGMWYALGVGMWAGTGAVAVWLLRRLAVQVREDGPRSAILGGLGIVCLAAVGAGLGYVLCQLPARALFVTGYETLDAADLAAIQAALSGVIAGSEEAALVFRTVGERVQPAVLIESLAGAAGPGSEGAIREAVMAQATAVREGYTGGEGLRPPAWLVSETWAKPALILMGIWTAVGGANMLLYLAGLSNVPESLYEAAAIDGASGWSRFRNVTWPQLAPTTFFIVIMSTIGGLQGGFDQAQAMTEGRYGTDVLTYYLYTLAFTDEFQLGLASAVAWVLFAVIFAVTLVNYRFGSRLVNE